MTQDDIRHIQRALSVLLSNPKSPEAARAYKLAVKNSNSIDTYRAYVKIMRTFGQEVGFEWAIPGTSYLFVSPQATYGATLTCLHNACANTLVQPTATIEDIILPRPLTTEENARAIVDVYNRSEMEYLRGDVLERQFVTCTGISRSAYSSKADVIPLCIGLLDTTLTTPVSVFLGHTKGSIVIDSEHKRARYNVPLSRIEAQEHEFIRAAIADDSVRKEYVRIVFSEMKERYGCDKGMQVVLPLSGSDEVRALHIQHLRFGAALGVFHGFTASMLYIAENITGKE